MYYKKIVTSNVLKLYIFPICHTDITGAQFEKMLNSFLKWAFVKLDNYYIIQGLIVTKDLYRTSGVAEDLETFSSKFLEAITNNSQTNLKLPLNESTIYIEAKFAENQLSNEILIEQNSSGPARFLAHKLKLDNITSSLGVYYYYNALRYAIIPKTTGLYIRVGDEGDQIQIMANEISTNLNTNV